MAHKGLKQLVSDESASLTYDQIGFDLMAVDHNLVDGKTYTILRQRMAQTVLIFFIKMFLLMILHIG